MKSGGGEGSLTGALLGSGKSRDPEIREGRGKGPRSRQGQASRLIAANSGRICPGSRGVARKAEIVLGPNPQGGASWRDDLEASPVEPPPDP